MTAVRETPAGRRLGHSTHPARLAHIPDAAAVTAAADASLARLRTDYIDLYYAHFDDAVTPIEETAGAFDALVKAEKVRAIAVSNHSGPRIREWLEAARRDGLPVRTLTP